MRKQVEGEALGETFGAYSHGVWAGATLYISGVTGNTPELAESPDIAQETRNAMLEAQAVLHAAGLSFDDVVETRVYITDINSFTEMNETYRSFFKQPYPARATVEVSGLADGANVEIVLTAYDQAKA